MKYLKTPAGTLKTKPKIAPPKHVGYKPGDPVKIQFGITKCKFLTPYPQALDYALTAPHPGYMFTPSFKSGNWDGQHHFITRIGYFPTGLLPVVVHILKTGKNPLINEDKEKHNVLKIIAQNVEVIPDKESEKYYYPGFENFFINRIDTLKVLDPKTGEFLFPISLLKDWVGVQPLNDLSTKILSLAKSLHNEGV